MSNTLEATLPYAAVESGELSLKRAHLRQDSSRIPPDVEWNSLNFKAGTKEILSDCWGNVKSGEVCAIMGPSGAGKSSLLNVLAGRSASAPGLSINGKVKVLGRYINPVEYRKRIAYVMQDDALMATATPREALTFSATMRLPPETTSEEINSLVKMYLTELGLDDCADVMVGGAFVKGISGGQRKRTSVGVELITEPALLFLDEPTSGLDSFTAYSLIKLLKNIATTKSSTILCTIHQPSSEVFFVFDKAIFMRQGRTFFLGAPSIVVDHFSCLGYTCPDNYNPSDFVMSLSQTADDSTVKERKLWMPVPEIASSEADDDTSIKVHDAEFLSDSSFEKQVWMLLQRELRNIKRDPTEMILRFGTTGFLNILYGLIFLNAGGQDNAGSADLNTHFGAISFVLVSSMFDTSAPTLLMFPFERPMFLREYTANTYGVSAYFLSKLAVEAVMNFLQTLEMYILAYFMMDLQGNFFYIVLTTWGLAMASCSVAVFCGCALKDVKAVSELSPLLFIPQMLFAGVFVPVAQVPVYLRWAQYLCSLKYSMNLFLLTEFHPSLDTCSSSGAAQENCENLLEQNNVREEDMWLYILLLFALFAAFRIAAAVLLHEKAKRFY